MSYENVECKRCGFQWYSEKFETEGEVPEHCKRCYQTEVQKIPDPPTKIDILKEEAVKKKNEIPGQIKQKRHDFTIWRENNRLLITMFETGLLITGLVSLLAYFLFL